MFGELYVYTVYAYREYMDRKKGDIFNMEKVEWGDLIIYPWSESRRSRDRVCVRG